RLLFYMLAAATLCATLLASTVSGLELFTGPISFSHTELALLLLAVLGTLLTPFILLVARLRRAVWSNGARVLELLDAVRRPVLAGLIAYGLTTLGLRFGDDVLSRFGNSGAFAPHPGLSWAGWSLVLPLVVAVAIAVSLMRRRWDVPEASKWRRHLLGAPLLTLATLACVSLVMTGARWRAEAAVTVAPSSPIEAVDGSVAPPAQMDAPPAEPNTPESAPQPPAPTAPPSHATDEELAQAIAQGVEGLLPLSEKHP